MTEEDEGIRAVREVRSRISAEHGHDPQRLVEHYMAEQERLRERLFRQPTPMKPEEEEDSPAP